MVPFPSSIAPPALGAARRFGRFSLQRLLGKSMRSMAWLVQEPPGGPDRVLMLPRVAPRDSASLARWLQRVRGASRLDHPHLAPAAEIGAAEGWPFVLYDLGDCATLSDRVGDKGLVPNVAAAVASQILQGLAFAHDAGLAHRDVQGFAVLVCDKGVARVMGLEVACLDGDLNVAADNRLLRDQHAAAMADVLQMGVLAHHMLVGAPALDEPDAAKVVDRLPPRGREIVRLSFTTAWPVPEPLRAIVNRATDRQERQRYRSARTLARALDGWLRADESSQDGPLVLLQDRLHRSGALPASPGGAERAARLALMERGRTDELAEVLLDDVALAFDLLRVVNTAQFRGTQVSGNGPVLTVRRAIAMLGLDGVRRVALALRPWPGPLAPEHASELGKLMDHARRAARVAVAIRPAGYDAEVVYLIALLQNLGRLIVQYHFADEAAQIRRLMQPVPLPDGGGEDPGMSEPVASMAVLGVDVESIGHAVARWWGMDDSVLRMMRRYDDAALVRKPESDADQLRAAASCANEAVEALLLPAQRASAALNGVAQRYGRALGLSLRDLQAALRQGAATLAEPAGRSASYAPAETVRADA